MAKTDAAKIEEDESEFDLGKTLRSSKKYIYAAGLGISLLGILCLIIFTLIINDAIDKTSQTITNNLNFAVENLQNAQIAAQAVETQLDGINTTIDSAQRSFGPLSSGIESTSVSLNGLSDMAAGLSAFGVSQNTIAQLRSASTSLHQSALTLNQSATSLNSQKNSMSQLKTSVGEIKNSINGQKNALILAKTDLESVFGNIKIANILFFLIIFGMLSILGINSAAGII